MKNNKLYSVLLGVLLMVPGQAICSELPQGIRERLWLSVPTMPAAPEWATNLVSGLSDNTKKFLLYGGFAAFLSYIGYRVINMASSSTASPSSTPNIPKDMEGRDFWSPNKDELTSMGNCSNIAYIIDWYPAVEGNKQKEAAFKHYVCPVLDAHQDKLDSKENWKAFLPTIRTNSFGITMLGTSGDFGIKVYKLIQRTCPNEKITNPLKELLIESNPKDTKLLEILNK